jgi:subtilisin-like proprotein convertase family protein
VAARFIHVASGTLRPVREMTMTPLLSSPTRTPRGVRWVTLWLLLAAGLLGALLVLPSAQAGNSTEVPAGPQAQIQVAADTPALVPSARPSNTHPSKSDGRSEGLGSEQSGTIQALDTTATTEAFTLVWSSNETDLTNSVAWGDYDKDGDLDLAVASGWYAEMFEPARLYRNDGGTLTVSAIWSSNETGALEQLAWGDYDNDGDLDLASADKMGPCRLYENSDGVLTADAVWTSNEASEYVGGGLAWGDYDGDGDFDLVCTTNQLVALHRNDGGTLTTNEVWSASTNLDSANDPAWGDYDNDGDLDLFVGTPGSTRLYRNDGGTLTTPAQEFGDNGVGIALGDYDADGDLDLVMSTYDDIRLYRNTGGTIATTPYWTASTGAEGLAWGDYDGDGDLDLATGLTNATGVYRNDSGSLTTDFIWSEESENANSVAWGDYDGDGDLDLAVGNWGQPNRLYSNNESGRLVATTSFSSGSQDTIMSLAWGDYDNDHDLDLVTGQQSNPVQLYRNDAGVVTASPIWTATLNEMTWSVAWGDYDNDGDLDLAVGNGRATTNGNPPVEYNRLYRNDAGTLTRDTDWNPPADDTSSLAWGDYDGDGDLDLAVGNGSQQTNGCCYVGAQNRLYRNDGGMLTDSPVWSSNEADSTRSIAWGDYDNDGDLDLVVGNYMQSNRLYRNDAGTLTSSAVWSSNEADLAQSVAWGDYDGDGDLDLAVANGSEDAYYQQPTRLYRNDAGTLTSSAIWSSIDAKNGWSVAWGDYDGDGDIDLAVGNNGYEGGAPILLYRNDSGTLTTSAAWTSGSNYSPFRIAWGDYDGDGALDLVTSNDDGGVIYHNSREATEIPSVQLTQPDLNADGYSDPSRWSDSTLTLSYTLSNGDGLLVREVQGYYSLNGDGQWLPAVASSSTITSNLTTGVFTETTTPLLVAGGTSESTTLLLANQAESTIKDLQVSLALSQTASSRLSVTLTSAWPAPTGTNIPLLENVYSTGLVNLNFTDDTTSDPSTQLSCTVYTSTDLPKTIIDSSPTTVTSTLTIPDTGAIADLNVLDLSGTHTWIGDLTISLQSPSGSSATLLNEPCDEAVNFDLGLDDEATTGSFPCPPIDGASYQPAESLAVFDGEEQQGTWTLTVQDSYSADGGSLDSWGLQVCTAQATALTSGEYRPREPLSALDEAPLNTPISLVLTDGVSGESTTLASWGLRSSGVEHTYTWDIAGSGVFGQSDNVVFRLVAFPALTPTLNGIPGPYLYGGYGTSTFPFGVRGSQIRVLSGTMPISDALVYRLEAGQTTGGELLTSSSGEAFRTNSQGYLQGSGSLAVGDQLLALAPVAFTSPFSSTLPNYTLSFDGVDDTVATADLSLANSSFSVAFWAKRGATGEGMIVGQGSGSPNESLALGFNDADQFVCGFGSNDLVTIVEYTDSDWHHWACTYDSASRTRRIYRDGAQVAEDTASANYAGSGTLLLGTDPANRFFNGSLDDVIVFDHALAASTVEEVYDGSPIALSDGVLAWWPFDEGSGTTTSDIGANSYEGTLNGPLWEEEASTERYTLYYTNGTPTSSGLDAYTVSGTGVQTLTVSSDHPLLLYDIQVSLEWDAHNDTAYLEQLEFDLKRASTHLYDWSDGQIALGNVYVNQKGDNWAYADVVIHATNRMRPWANQGGLVVTPTLDPLTSTIEYGSGQVRMGATWNRYGTSSGNLGQDWPLILGHELGHYLLFQDDVYLGTDDQGNLIAVDTCTGSAMGDVYRTSNTEFIWDEGHWQTDCADTLAAKTLQRTEWQTMQTWYPWLVTPTTTNSGPSQMPFDLTAVTIKDPITPTAALDDPTFYLSYANSAVSSVEARAYLLRDDYVVNIGNPSGGQNRVLARGAEPGDRLCVFDRLYNQYGCETIESGDDQLSLEQDDTWTPLIQLTPVISTTYTIEVSLLPSGLTLKARLFPEDDAGSEVITLVESNGTYSSTFNLENPTLAGHVQLWVDESTTETDPRRETIVAFSVGGNPGIARAGGGIARAGGGIARAGGGIARAGGGIARAGGGIARAGGGIARAGGGIARAGGAPLISPDGQMTFYSDDSVTYEEGQFYTIQAMAALPTLPPGRTVIGQGYRLMATTGTPVVTGSISFQYLSSDVLVAGVDEDLLSVYFYEGSMWQELTTERDAYFNLASAPSQGVGLYALMASVQISLEAPGWNLFSYPVRTSRPVTEALLSISGYYTTVYGYDATDSTDPWRVYDVSVPAYVNTLTDLEYGHGYWINVSQPITIHLPADSETLLTSANIPPSPPATFYGLVADQPGAPASAGVAVRAWVNGKQCGQGQTQLIGGQVVYAIHVLANGAGQASGCSQLGQLISFQVGSQMVTTTAPWDNRQLWHLPLGTTSGVKYYLPLVLRAGTNQ